MIAQDDKNLTTIYLVRHAQSEGNVLGIAQGQLDYPLTQEGERQAKELAKEFKDIHFSAIFSSDLIRAKRTAEEVAIERNLEVKATVVLRERSRGRFSGQLVQELQEELDRLIKHHESLSEEAKKKFKFEKDYESDEEIISRVLTFLREISFAYRGKTILVVSHSGVIRSLLLHFGFATFETLQRGSMENTGYVKLLSDGVQFSVAETKRVNIGSTRLGVE